MRRLACLAVIFGCGHQPVPKGPALPAERLELGKPIERPFGSAPERFRIDLVAGQVLLASVDQRGGDAVARVFGPDGAKVADVDTGDSGRERIVLEVKRTGAYVLEVTRWTVEPAPAAAPVAATATTGKFEASVDEILTAAGWEVRRAERTVDSPRVLAVWKAVVGGDHEAAERFWTALRGRAPIVEPYPGDPSSVLVTFVFRSTENYVGLFLGPTAHEVPMTRIADTHLWYLSARTLPDARLAYAFYAGAAPREHHAAWRRFDDQSDGRWVAKVMDPSNDKAQFDLSYAELPGASPQPWIAAKPGGAAGTLAPLAIASAAMGEQRRSWVYTPAGYEPGKTYPLVVAFDGESYGGDPAGTAIPLPRILDNLIAAKQIPPVVAVLVANQGTRNRDLPASSPFAKFVTGELIPKIRADYHAGLTPAQTLVTGSSFGGLCSTYIGLLHSDVVGNVLSQSGAYWFRPGGLERDLPVTDEPGWLIHQYVASPKLPVRFYLDVGRFETGTDADILPLNRHLRDVLLSKGYEVHYTEFSGGHDPFEWRGTISDGLIALLGGH